MKLLWNKDSLLSKKAFMVMGCVCLIGVAACSVNPATGDRQFTALLPADKEAAIGAQEHVKIEQTFGKFMTGPIADYVSRIGAKIAQDTERPDVQYKFFVIDSPIVNAFALPGGYIYISRGLLNLANSEAEVAGVLAHEVGHVTARHAAERVSQGFLVGLGAAVIGAAANTPGVSQAAGLGSELYIKSYSRGQEHESDYLGVRYLARAGYDPMAMADFLRSLDAQTKLDARLAGKNANTGPNYFSTHPVTADRVIQATQKAQQVSVERPIVRRDEFLQQINGLVYGDSADQGFIRGNKFYHTALGFTFSVPQGSKMVNSPAAVNASHPNGTIIIFDVGKDQTNSDPLGYIRNVWLKNRNVTDGESITVNGMRGATASFPGTIQGIAATIRLVAIEWKPGEFYRFQMAIPQNVTSAFIEELKTTTYSLRRLSASEKQSIQPKKIRLVTARSGDTVASLAAQMDVDELKEDQFRVLNGLIGNTPIVSGRLYKIISD